MAKRSRWNYNYYDLPISDNKKAKIAKVEASGPPSTVETRAERAAAHQAGADPKVIAAHYYLVKAEEEEDHLNGIPVHDVTFNTTPVLKGQVLPGEEPNFKIAFAHTLDKNFARKLSSIELVNVGTRDPGVISHIGSILDPVTKRADDTFTVGKPLFIYGEHIKVIGDPQPTEGTVEAGIGVFFVPPAGAAVQVSNASIYINDPSLLQVEVPATLAKNTLFTLRIVTRYANSGKLLKEPRTIEYASKIKSNA
jgi:hypothetical protein